MYWIPIINALKEFCLLFSSNFAFSGKSSDDGDDQPGELPSDLSLYVLKLTV